MRVACFGTMNWRPYGRNTVLIDFAEKPDEWAFHKCRAMIQALLEDPPSYLVEFVPGYTTMLLEFATPNSESIEQLANHSIAFLESHALKKLPLGPLHRVPVRYDGPDLQRVAEHNGLTKAQMIEFHSARTYKVYLLGFSPGFPYLGELHHRLRTPRLASPRPRVPAGAVAIGGEHTGIYTVDSPGGWNIIGFTEFKPFDLSKAPTGREEEAFALKVGDQIRFEPV
jgi:inhibitor of KinA